MTSIACCMHRACKNYWFMLQAAELIQESWRGHRARQEISHRLKENEQEEEEERKEKEDKIKEKARMELVEKEREARRNENGRNGRQERNGERTQNETDKLRRVKEEAREEVKEEKRVKEESEDERHHVDYDDAVEVIQSTVRAHIYRSHQIKSLVKEQSISTLSCYLLLLFIIVFILHLLSTTHYQVLVRNLL